MIKDMFDTKDNLNYSKEDIFLNDSDKQKEIQPPIPLRDNNNIVKINDLVYLRVDNKSKNHYCFLEDEIYSDMLFSNLIILLNSMQEDETLTIDIMSYGGDISLMNMICSAIFRCKGKVITNIISFAYSAGSAIWACGHELKVSPNAHALFHMGLSGGYGRIDELAIQNNITYKFLNKLFNYFVSRGILTKEELNDIYMKKIDVILSYTQLKERIEIANNKGFINSLIPKETQNEE